MMNNANQYLDDETITTLFYKKLFKSHPELKNVFNLAPQKNADYYSCGLKPFMVSLHKTLSLWGVDKNSTHYEVFGSGKVLY